MMTAPIAVLDSGIGGLTVAAALRRELPHEDIIYFGDTARAPYGTKSPATVTAYVLQAVRYLRGFAPKHLVIACNTSSALAINAVRQEFVGISMNGTIEPGARAAATAAGKTRHPVIGILATEATILSKAYMHAIARRRTHARLLFRPAPLLIPILEEGRAAEDPLIEFAVRQYLAGMMQSGLEVLLLGCSHYGLLKNMITEVVGPSVTVIDSAERCAEDVCRRLQAGGLLRGDTDRQGKLHCFMTDEPPRFETLARRFLGFDVPATTWVRLEDLYDCQHDELRLAKVEAA